MTADILSLVQFVQHDVISLGACFMCVLGAMMASGFFAVFLCTEEHVAPVLPCSIWQFESRGGFFSVV